MYIFARARALRDKVDDRPRDMRFSRCGNCNLFLSNAFPRSHVQPCNRDGP